MKRRFPLMSIVLLLTLLLSACGGGSGSTSDTTELRYMIWDKNQAPTIQVIIDNFEKVHPSIKVTLEVTPWAQYWTKLETAATGGSLADVFWMNGPNIIKYASNGVVSPITNQIKADSVDMSKYPSALVQMYSYNGDNYAIPKDFDTVGLWYNKALFDEAGLAYPDKTWTWQTAQDAAAKLTNKSKGVWGIAAAMADQAGFYDTILQNGGNIISDDKKTSGFGTEEAIGGLKYWTDFIQKGYSPTQAQMTDTEPPTLFESGKVAMFYSGSWQTGEFNSNSYTKEHADVAVLPQGKKRATVIHGLATTISANTKYPDQAWQFVKYLGSKDAAAVEASKGTAIPAYEGYQETWRKSMKFNLQAFIDELDYAYPYPISKNTAAWITVQNEILTKVWSGSLSVEDGAKQVAQQMNALLAKE
jgi:multiple sugar transport system substrate-binding protein